jgi:hypothetical protein
MELFITDPDAEADPKYCKMKFLEQVIKIQICGCMIDLISRISK